MLLWLWTFPYFTAEFCLGTYTALLVSMNTTLMDWSTPSRSEVYQITIVDITTASRTSRYQLVFD